VKIVIAEEVHPLLDEIRRQSSVTVDVVAPAIRGWKAGPGVLDAEVMLATHPPGNLRAMTQLRWIQLGSAGFEQLFDLPLVEMGITVTNCSGVNDVPIAEWCIGMMFVFERDFARMLQNQRDHVWDRDRKFQAELRGRLVGILGYGNIGREVARQCRALGLRVWVMGRRLGPEKPDRYTVDGTGDPDGILPERTFSLEQMADFLPQLDYLVLALPRTPGTEGILGARELAQLKPSAVLLNPARAELMEESALLDALRVRRFAGAALDVHYDFPLSADHPLWEMPNVILTPWISGSTGSPYYQPRLWDLFHKNLERYSTGQPLLNVIPPADLNPQPRGA
jgi:phosphoglycerate dehydrogenase-like enzyme